MVESAFGEPWKTMLSASLPKVKYRSVGSSRVPWENFIPDGWIQKPVPANDNQPLASGILTSQSTLMVAPFGEKVMLMIASVTGVPPMFWLSIPIGKLTGVLPVIWLISWLALLLERKLSTPLDNWSSWDPDALEKLAQDPKP